MLASPSQNGERTRTRTRSAPPPPPPPPTPTPPPTRPQVRLSVDERVSESKYRVLTHVREAAQDSGREVHRDTISLDGATARTKYARAARKVIPGGDTDAMQSELERELLRLAQEAQAQAVEEAAARATEPAPAVVPTVYEIGQERLAQTPADIREEAADLLRSPNLIDRVYEHIRLLGVAGERTLALVLFLIGVSRMLPRPLAGIVQGLSSSGKSYTVETVGGMFPEEAVIRATAMTPQALYHMPAGALSHRWVLAGERSRRENDEQAEATRALREMLSAGRLSKLMPVKEDGEIVTVLIEKEGPIAFSETTTLTEIFNEDANRCLLLQTDERDSQTQAVLAATAAKFAGRSTTGEVERLRAVHHALQRMIPLADVIIPFADPVAVLFNTARVEARRNYSQLMALTQALTLLHHKQREKDDDGRLIATRADYTIAAELAADSMARAVGRLPDSVQRFWERLRPRVENRHWTTTEARTGESVNKATTQRWLDLLQDAGVIEVTEPGKGNMPATWRACPRRNPPRGADACQETPPVPRPEDVFASPHSAH